jgi:DNA-binding HxlR family transcriptional regulator
VKIQGFRDRALQSRHAVELLSDKWRITVLHLLTPGRLRTNQLQRAIDQVSAKMLTQTLRGMKRDGLIERRILSVVPARVEYQLTTMGESVIPLLRDLCRWAKEHTTERDSARSRFDSQHNAAETGLPARPTSKGSSYRSFLMQPHRTVGSEY